jgi:hypothetical protein
VCSAQYSKDDDALVFSDLYNQVIVKVRRSDGSTVWVLNGTKPTFTGDTWAGGQHGIHVLAEDRLLIFNNNSRKNAGGAVGLGGTGDGSIAAEFELDLTGKTISKVWSYKSDLANDVHGDVQRMDNGNTVVGFSTQGGVREVDAGGNVLQEWTWTIGQAFGYFHKRRRHTGRPSGSQHCHPGIARRAPNRKGASIHHRAPYTERNRSGGPLCVWARSRQFIHRA